MPILFHDFLEAKLNRPKPKGGTYWGALCRLVDIYDHSPANWVTEHKLKEIHRLRQLDKFEPVITYYLFAALAEATHGFADGDSLMELLRAAYSSEHAAVISEHSARYSDMSLEFEAQIVPNGTLRAHVKRSIANSPVEYNRRFALERKRVRFESGTRLDCFIGDGRSLGKNANRDAGLFGLGTEAKFTSDIDDETTHSPDRNQIARIVEVGNQRCALFYFLLIAPQRYRDAKSRLYVYKMEEYQGPNGVAALRRDILLPQPDEVLARWIQRIGWLDWEHIVQFLYPAGRARGGWDSIYSAPLEQFLRNRRLWPFG